VDGYDERRRFGRRLVTVLSADWVVPVEEAPIANGAIAIEDGRIAAIGTVDELGTDEHHLDGVIVPGLVNAHSHLEYAGYGGFGDGLPFGEWIAVHMERKRRLDVEGTEDLARLGALECLSSGITTVGDASFAGASVQACAETGLRAIVYLEVFGQDAATVAAQLGPKRERAAAFVSDRVQLGVSPHAPYTCSTELYAACLDLALPIATHLAESPGEHEWLTTGRGPWSELLADVLLPSPGATGISLLARAGVLGPAIAAAHCVTVDETEIALLAEHDVAVVHCPRSNAYLGCGVAPIAALLAAGIRVGLGTDSPASAPSFDLFDEMRAALTASRARERDPRALGTAQVLELATLGGARALGLDDEVGSLRVGKRADLAILSFAGSSYVPWEDPVSAIVLDGRPERIVATIVDGERRYTRGGNAWPDTRSRASRARSRMLDERPIAPALPR
jgi:cytosine/adenosine deaminase-related metal-dependent hydrolase